MADFPFFLLQPSSSAPIADFLLTYQILVDWNGNGLFDNAYSDITQDYTLCRGDYGRDHATQDTARAVTGTLELNLRNFTGKYSKNNATSPIYGLIKTGRRVKVSMLTPYPVMLWTGELQDVETQTGSLPTATLSAVGILSRLARTQVKPAAQTNALTGSIITAILDAAGQPSGERAIDAGELVVPNWYGEGFALPLIQELEATEVGFFYELPGWIAAYEARYHRIRNNHLLSQQTFSDDPADSYYYQAINEINSRQFVVNDASSDIQTYTAGALSELWRLSGEIPTLAPGETITLYARYPNASNTTGAYAGSWTTPDSTDIVPTGVAFSDLGISVVKRSQQMDIAITNNHISAACQLPTVRARGVPMLKNALTQVTSHDLTSQGYFGVISDPLERKWFANRAFAQSTLDKIIADNADERQILSVAFLAYNAAILRELISRTISDRITLKATGPLTQLGTNADFFIEKIAFEFDARQSFKMAWEVSPASSDPGYWILGTSQLGTGSKLAY